MGQKSRLEEKLATVLDAAGIAYARQIRCIPGRQYRADFLILVGGAEEEGRRRLCVEVDGGVWIAHNNRGKWGRQGAGGHQSGYGKESDGERDCVFLASGVVTLRVTERQIVSGVVVDAVRKWIEMQGER